MFCHFILIEMAFLLFELFWFGKFALFVLMFFRLNQNICLLQNIDI